MTERLSMRALYSTGTLLSTPCGLRGKGTPKRGDIDAYTELINSDVR